ncbi:hypothetical protein HJFPF1_07454 [Paramyrothecium foliicola]|nr:hypothetical protein HJFPF1_07454 [Paramyrothecium foliicola]
MASNSCSYINGPGCPAKRWGLIMNDCNGQHEPSIALENARFILLGQDTTPRSLEEFFPDEEVVTSELCGLDWERVLRCLNFSPEEAAEERLAIKIRGIDNALSLATEDDYCPHAGHVIIFGTASQMERAKQRSWLDCVIDAFERAQLIQPAPKPQCQQVGSSGSNSSTMTDTPRPVSPMVVTIPKDDAQRSSDGDVIDVDAIYPSDGEGDIKIIDVDAEYPSDGQNDELPSELQQDQFLRLL